MSDVNGKDSAAVSLSIYTKDMALAFSDFDFTLTVCASWRKMKELTMC